MQEFILRQLTVFSRRTLLLTYLKKNTSNYNIQVPDDWREKGALNFNNIFKINISEKIDFGWEDGYAKPISHPKYKKMHAF
jgi:hypothetical protein